MMMMMDVYDITASALSAQRLRMDTIASNLANVNTTRQADGTVGAYKRKNLVFAPLLKQAQQQQGLQESLSEQASSTASGTNRHFAINGISGQQGTYKAGISASDEAQALVGVQVLNVVEDNSTPVRKVFDPSHPDADKEGFVEYPNVNAVTEMVDLMSASRAYEASVSVFQNTKSMNEGLLQM
jgi:flagellar basal-body rod protein FlgC